MAEADARQYPLFRRLLLGRAYTRRDFFHMELGMCVSVYAVWDLECLQGAVGNEATGGLLTGIRFRRRDRGAMGLFY